MLRISWLFCIFRYSPANKVWKPKRGKFSNKDMAKVQNISEIHPTLGLQNLIFWKIPLRFRVCAVSTTSQRKEKESFIE